jgi:hypothetical protein
MREADRRELRWAFMQRQVIKCQDGLDYLIRWRVVQTPWFAVYLHDLLEPDSARDPHDHPWTFWSVILRGGYVEKIWEQDPQLGVGGFHRVVGWWSRSYRRRWLAGSVHKMTMDKAHMIQFVQPGTRSLIICGPRRRTWGFWTEEGFVPWTEYRP